MAGILSVLDNIFDVDLAEVVTNLRLPKTVTQALIAHEGPLGGLLTIAETLDETYGTIDLAKMEACGVSQTEVHLAMFKAYQWLSAPASRTESD
jgi:EAL and modified HD-GYP domain-containing signal transduction protein